LHADLAPLSLHNRLACNGLAGSAEREQDGGTMALRPCLDSAAFARPTRKKQSSLILGSD
jgi:hypothetical protein